ncbi:MAG TPA: efflux transporter periplasmic adaptor subunit [Alphaproteobacteria bacterium]|nr:efflux transporter periplasmic adaptor subunit [Alphaproteobacteria bacterium]
MKAKYIAIIAALLIITAIIYKMFFGFAGMPSGMYGGNSGEAMPVSVVLVKKQQVNIIKEFSGRVEAYEKADIRPKVSGEITQILFKEGDHVKKDQPLFVIDTRPYQAALNSAYANSAAASSTLENARKEFNRAAELIKVQAISRKEFDEKSSMLKIAENNHKVAQAAITINRLNVEYANVKAPISGKIGRAEILKGNLVDPSAGQVMTTIVNDDKFYVDFEIDEQAYVNFTSNPANEDVSKIPVKILLAGQSDAKVEGVISSFDNQINPNSGTIRVRAVIENKNKKIISGLFAKVQIGNAVAEEKLVISDTYIMTDQDKRFVYVVGADNKVEYRTVTLGEKVNGSRIVLEGLKEGEMIVSKALQKVRPSVPVKPIISEDQQTQ